MMGVQLWTLLKWVQQLVKFCSVIPLWGTVGGKYLFVLFNENYLMHKKLLYFSPDENGETTLDAMVFELPEC